MAEFLFPLLGWNSSLIGKWRETEEMEHDKAPNSRSTFNYWCKKIKYECEDCL